MASLVIIEHSTGRLVQGEFFEALVEAFRLNGLKYLQSDMLLLPLPEERTRAKEHPRSPQVNSEDRSCFLA